MRINMGRKPSGVSMIVIAFMAAFFILLPLGVFGFELLRFSVAQLQLRSICDAAALSGAVGVASTSSGWTPTIAQNNAMDCAYITFRQNVLIGTLLSNPGVCTVHKNDGTRPDSPPPAPGKCNVCFTLEDQNGNTVATGDPAAKVIRCEAGYGYVPPLGSALGFTNVPLYAFAEGGLPQLDIVLCFDVSGSMDDQTRVTFVNRYWNAGSGKTAYARVSTNQAAPTPKSSIYTIQKPPNEGTPLNASSPQNLTTAQYGPIYTSGNQFPYTFNPNRRCHSSAASEVGQPPGNQVDPTIGTGPIVFVNGASNPEFTDLVVNLDGNDVFTGFTDTVTGLNFPNIGALCEASRGNFDSAANMATACPGFPGVTANPAYSATYKTLAEAKLEPMNTARNAAANFYNTMNISANCHFGLIAFSDDVGSTDTSTWEGLGGSTTDKLIDKNYARGGTGTYPLPNVKLVKAAAQTNYTECRNAAKTLKATGKTNLAAAINEALSQLTVANGMTRDKARRAIILFTDGIPNIPGGSAGGFGSPAASAARTAADTAAASNIPIYAIGLSQNASIKPTMDAILQDICDRTNGQYISVTTPSDLDTAFQTIAKSLIVLK